MAPQLSVIIPTYKRTDSLEKLLDCLKNQKNILLEIIIVDQNEQGFLKKVIGETMLMNVQHLYQEEPNVSSARNLGAKHANAEYIVLFDDDIIPGPDFCEKGISILQQNRNIKILTPTLLRKRETASDVLPKKISENIYMLSLKYKYQHASFFTVSACTFYDKKTFLNSGGFDENLFSFAKTAEDQEFFIRLLKNNFTVYLSTDLQVLVDEDVAGGCELRTEDYWLTRKKCVRAWVYKYRMHNKVPGKLNLSDIILLSRHTFLNSSLFTRSLKNTLKQISTLVAAVGDSKLFIKQYQKNLFIKNMDYLNQYPIQNNNDK